MSLEERFVDNGDGTVTDKDTGLAWCKEDSFQIVHEWLDFKESLKFIDERNREDYLGYHDWRMPEKEEVAKLFYPEHTLKARSNQIVHLHPAFEPGCGTGTWCLPFDPQAAFYFSYQSGESQTFDQDFNQGYLRLVRLYPD
jgi:hypothetical protein